MLFVVVLGFVGFLTSVKGLFDGKGIFPGLPDREKSTNEPVSLAKQEGVKSRVE